MAMTIKRLLLNGAAQVAALGRATILEGSAPEEIRRLIQTLKVRWKPSDLIRIGARHDGGYLVPPDVDTYELLISPGVGFSSEFDRYFAERGIEAILIDPTVEIAVGPHMRHIKKFVSPVGSPESRNVTLPQLLEQFGSGKKRIILQMDIEGAEYSVLNACSEETLARFGVIVIELHHLAGLTYRGMLPQISEALSRISATHFPAHLHVNNSGRIASYRGISIPNTLELTFLRHGLYHPSDECSFVSPHPLDAPCVATAAEVAVPRSWW